ncbi:MAG: FAD-linked oxidase C-terminal domain-containing protein [Oceanipulchritudo sp.]
MKSGVAGVGWDPGCLEALVGRERLLCSPAQLAGYEADGLGCKRYRPEAVVIPGDVAALKEVVRELGKLEVPYVIRGAGTSLSGGPVAVEGGVVIHLSHLRAIESINVAERYAVVESGVVLADLEKAVGRHGLYYPPDPSTGTVCTLGGNVASNAGGVHCFRYGVTSHYVLGVEVILTDGRVVCFGGPGGGRGDWREDWKRLFIGSEGTLGVFTRFWLRLIPRPEKVWTFRATYRELEAASEAIRRLASHPAYPSAIELMDPPCVDMVENSPMRVGLPKGSFMLLTEIDGPPELVDGRVEAIAGILRECGSGDVVYSDEAGERERLWRARKVQGGLLGQISPDFIVQDAVIPKAYLGEVLTFIYREAEAEGIAVVTIMHAGDGNLHPDFMFDSRDPEQLEKVERLGKNLMRKVSEIGGTLSGEHGIGSDKSGYMKAHLGEVAEAMQMTVPGLFNESHQLNPRKVFPERRFR